MRIIYADDDDYALLLILADLDTLESRRAQLSERFFKRSVLPESSCLHYLLPDKRDTSDRPTASRLDIRTADYSGC